MLRLIICDPIEYEENAYAFAVDCDPKLDIEQAVKDAAQEYFKTEDGMNRHEDIIENDENWSWSEAFYEIPRDILKKHGIIIPELGECVFANSNDDMTGDDNEDSENWTCSCGNETDCIMTIREWIEEEKDSLTQSEINKLMNHSNEVDSDICEDCWEKYKGRILNN